MKQPCVVPLCVAYGDTSGKYPPWFCPVHGAMTAADRAELMQRKCGLVAQVVPADIGRIEYERAETA